MSLKRSLVKNNKMKTETEPSKVGIVESVVLVTRQGGHIRIK